jgi:hypothetical protein
MGNRTAALLNRLRGFRTVWMHRIILALCLGSPVALSFLIPAPPAVPLAVSPAPSRGETSPAAPHRIYTLPCCLFRAVAGIPCPLCGLTRSFVSLSHGEFRAAFTYHPLGPILYVGCLVGCLGQFWPRPSPPRTPDHEATPGFWRRRAGWLLMASFLLAWAAKLFLLPRAYW